MSQDDLARLRQSMPAGVVGYQDVGKFVRDSNDEVRNMFNDEVNMMMECRYCRNMFRDPMDFVLHKTTYCRGTTVQANRRPRGGGKAEVAPKRRSLAMRQNPAPIEDDQGVVPLYTLPRSMKEVPTITSDDEIQKVIGSLPSSMAGMEFLHADKRMPLDNSNRYKKKSLRSQSSINTKNTEEKEEEERISLMRRRTNSSKLKENPLRPRGKEEGTEEDEDNVDRNVSSRLRSRSCVRGASVVVPLLKMPEAIQRQSGRSHNSDDYGDPSKLDDFGFEEESSTPPRARSASVVKKKGRSGKSLDRTDKPTVNRPKRAESLAPTQKVKRQYIKKKDREMMELRARSEVPSAASAAETARPSRQRKPSTWMTNGGGEVYEDGNESSQNIDQSTADESDYASTSKEETKKENEKQVVTPVVKRDSTPVPKVSDVIGDDQKKEVLLFTPKAGQAVIERRRAMVIPKVNDSCSKRKQNLGQLIDPEEDIVIVSVNERMDGKTRNSLSSIPVFISEHLRSIFFSGLIHLKDSENNGKSYFECKYCHAILPNKQEGRRHMVAHLGVMRLICGLCGAGAFFCIDMRNHLQLRGCPELAKAPQHMIQPGTPCMSKEHADELAFVAHPDDPGHVLFTSGKIVSIMSNTPYLPDPVMEEMILGPTRVPPRAISSSLLKWDEQGRDAAAAAVVSPSSDPMPLLPIRDPSASMQHYHGIAAAAAHDGERMLQQLQSGHSAAEREQATQRILNTMPSRSAIQMMEPTRRGQMQPSADAEMRPALPAGHRSMYRPNYSRRESSPDGSTSSTSY